MTGNVEHARCRVKRLQLTSSNLDFMHVVGLSSTRETLFTGTRKRRAGTQRQFGGMTLRGKQEQLARAFTRH